MQYYLKRNIPEKYKKYLRANELIQKSVPAYKIKQKNKIDRSRRNPALFFWHIVHKKSGDAPLSYIHNNLKEANMENITDTAEKVFKLTGEPISRELKSVLENLAAGRYVSQEQIDKCPEIVLANTILSDSKPTYMLAGREALREHILKKLEEKGAANIANDGTVCYNNIVNRGSRLDIIVGLPGSGKSSALADAISQEFNSIIIDNDEAKKMLPEYNNGWGASVVHEESKRISYKQLYGAMYDGMNIVLPRVGGNEEKLEATINYAKSKGYSVYLHYVELTRDKALGRMLDRFISTGRYLEPQLIDKYCNSIDGNKIEQAYESIKGKYIIDGYSRWNNDVDPGELPRLVEYKNTADIVDCVTNIFSDERNNRDRLKR